MPTLTKLHEAPLDSAPDQRTPGGWYDPDSSAFEPLAGVAAVNDAVASSLEADRTMDAPPADPDEV